MSATAPTTAVTYVVRTRIYGYNGMGYDHLSHVESSHATELSARERMAAIQAVRQAATVTNCTDDEAADELEWDLTDGRSYCFKGDPVLIKRTVTEEVVP